MAFKPVLAHASCVSSTLLPSVKPVKKYCVACLSALHSVNIWATRENAGLCIYMKAVGNDNIPVRCIIRITYSCNSTYSQYSVFQRITTAD